MASVHFILNYTVLPESASSYKDMVKLKHHCRMPNTSIVTVMHHKQYMQSLQQIR